MIVRMPRLVLSQGFTRKPGPRQHVDAGNTHQNDEDTKLRFNRRLCERYSSRVGQQIDRWNRSAVHNSNLKASHLVWLKAESLGCALGLRYAFDLEFRELVGCESDKTGPDVPVLPAEHHERKST